MSESSKPRRRALDAKHTPRTLSLSFFAMVWLLMDRLNPPGWVWGVVGTICAVIFIAKVIDFFTAEDVSL